ncbi:hypothetical protein BDR06DRAFT_960514 [Suillus hirtellus]|nr:hypothetical protein BDR06DRAFT_960514 [Suillus hirtellus]
MSRDASYHVSLTSATDDQPLQRICSSWLEMRTKDCLLPVGEIRRRELLSALNAHYETGIYRKIAATS